jgi:DNA-binding NarL/FixJ family response regulator
MTDDDPNEAYEVVPIKSGPHGPPKTPYEDERLRALALSGTTAAKIAEQLNRSEGAVRKRATRLSIVLSSRARAPKTESEISF